MDAPDGNPSFEISALPRSVRTISRRGEVPIMVAGIRNRPLWLWASMVLLLVGVGSCSRAAREPAQEAGNPSEAIATDRELTVAAGADTYRTDPPERATLGMYPWNASIYETLVVLTPKYTVAPGLAERWEYRGGNTWRFYLRRGVVFHDGQPLTAAAVRYSFQRIARAGGGTPGLREDSVAVVDDYTVDITPGRPNLRLVEQLTHPNYSIIAPGSNPGKLPVGTGPFRFVEYKPGEYLLVERFNRYWGNPAGFQRLRIRFIPDGNTRLLALRSGSVDAIADVPREAVSEVASMPGVQVFRAPVGAYQALYFNIRGETPYDLGRDRAVRRAVAMAIDPEPIVREVWAGAAEAQRTFVPAAMLGPHADRVRGTMHDLEQARRLLQESGWQPGPDGIRVREGRRLKLVLVVGFPNAEVHRPLPELLQAQLRKAGIELAIAMTPDLASYSARLERGEGDLWAELGSQNDANPCFLPDLLFYRGGPTGAEMPYPRWFGPGDRFDRLIERCRTAESFEEAQRWAAEAIRVLVEDEVVVVPVVGVSRVYALRQGLTGFVPHPSGTNQRWDSVRPAK